MGRQEIPRAILPGEAALPQGPTVPASAEVLQVQTIPEAAGVVQMGAHLQ